MRKSFKIIGVLLATIAVFMMSMVVSSADAPAVEPECIVESVSVPAITYEDIVEEVEGESCCAYATNSCCWRICCEQVTNWYRVSYFDDNGNWTSNYVEMSVLDGADGAAEYFGRRAGYDCFVVCMVGYDPAG